MSELERIRKYIDKTKCVDDRYDASTPEIMLLAQLCALQPIEGVALAFNYGRAKGYRKGKKEARA